MTQPLTNTEVAQAAERLEQAIAHDLALSAADLQCLLQIVLSFAHWHERLSERDITLHKLRKLAGIGTERSCSRSTNT